MIPKFSLSFVFPTSSLYNNQENEANIFFWQLSSMVNKMTNPKFKIFNNLNTE